MLRAPNLLAELDPVFNPTNIYRLDGNHPIYPHFLLTKCPLLNVAKLSVAVHFYLAEKINLKNYDLVRGAPSIC